MNIKMQGLTLTTSSAESIKELKAKNILLLWLGKIGDYVVSTPFIQAVRQKHPDAHIAVMVRPPVHELAILTEEVDDVIVFPKGAKSFKKIPELISKVLFKRWDMCIDMNPSYSGSSGRITVLSGAVYTVGFANPKAAKYYNTTVAKAGSTEHMMHRYDRLAELLGLSHSYQMHLSLVESDLMSVGYILHGLGINKDFIVLHPGNFKKDYSCWPKENFIRLSRDIKEHYPEYLQIYLAGPGEREIVQEMVDQIGEGAILAPPMVLPLTAAFLSAAKLTVVNSTGTLHMSEAVGTPTLSFHKEYSYLCWRPLETKGAALSSGDWDSVHPLPYETVWDTFKDITARIG